MTTLAVPALALLLALPLLGAAAAAPPESPEGAERVSVVGTAHDAKAGALVVTVTGTTWFVGGLESWPDGLGDRQVRVDGVPVRQAVFPTATQDEHGSWTQGVAAGAAPDRVLQDASWALLPVVQGLEPGPWRVIYADGSGNSTAIWRVGSGDAIGWSYDPVTPAQSSTGEYSGDLPADGSWGSAAATALWITLRLLEADASLHADARAKGTGAVTIITPLGSRDFLLAGGSALEDFEGLLPGR